MKFSGCISLLLCSLFFISCKDERLAANERFLSKYGDWNFKKYFNYWAVCRGSNDRVNMTFIVASSRGGGPYRVIVDKGSHTILEFQRLWPRDSSNFSPDTVLMLNMAIMIDSMDLFSLSVDSNYSIFVKTSSQEHGPDLVKFSNNKFITDSYKKGWVERNDGWIELIEP